MLFRRELATPSFCEEMRPLLFKHYREIAHFQDIEFNPSFEEYVKMEEFGFLRCFTARDDGNGVLLGYAIFFVKHNLHYKTSLQASQDVLFIHPDYRSAGFGAKFISFCDDELRKENVQAVYHHVKQAHNFGPLLEKLGYQLVDLIYACRLDKEKI